jgi:RNA polymerase sigma factor (sigma-70 family)
MPQTESTPTPPTLDYAAMYATGHRVLLRYLYGQAAQRSGRVSPEALEDVAQTAWLKLWQRWPYLDFRDAAAAWDYLYVTARNQLIEQWRHQQMTLRRGELAMTNDIWEWSIEHIPTYRRDESPEAATIAAESRRELEQVITRTLTSGDAATRHVARDRAIMTAWANGDPHQVIAERLGMTASAVKMHWHRLYVRLRSQAARNADAQRLRLDLQALRQGRAREWPDVQEVAS